MSTKKSTKTLFTLSYKLIYSLMIVAMLLAGYGIKPVSAASSTISGNAGVGGATITWNGSSGSSDGSTTADSSGNYSFTITYDYSWWGWSGTVTPSKAGYTFSPSNRTYSRVTSSQTNQNYTATPVTYTISGSVGSGGGGATISWNGTTSGSTTASGSGSYSFTVGYGWTGTVTPTKNGYTFDPTSRDYTNVTSNRSNQNYTATQAGYTISGNVGVSSATITYTGGSTTSNSSGNYSFFVSPGWSGTVTPSRSGFSFWPASRTYTSVSANETAQDYTPRPTTFTFGSMADVHGADWFSYSADQLASLNPALVILSGDFEDDGFQTAQMNPMVSILKNEGLYNKTFLVRGNHDDHQEGSAAGWESYFETSPNIPTRPAYVANKAALNSSSDYLSYSFDYGNSIFIGLDVPGDIYLLDQAEIDFLDARLTYAENAGLTHAFIFFHGPEYCAELTHCTCGARSDSACTPPALISVINNHPIVSAIFHGHEHVLYWTHMDNTRVSDLTRSYESFGTSPAGAGSYSSTIIPERVDYAYTEMQEDDVAYATINVNGLSFTVNFHKYQYGTTTPVWSHTFSKVNTPPTISDITDQTTGEDTSTGAIPFTVGDVELNPANLTITITSSDLSLVPAGNISLGGSGADRTLDILPAPNQSGTATITVSVNDGNVTVEDTFLLTVNAVNDPPVADPQLVSMPWNTSMNIVLTGSDVEDSPVTFDIVDNPAHGSLSGSGANQQYTPTSGYSGTDSFTFTAYDGELYSAPATVSITVTAYTISGNVGVAGATLSYVDGTPKTVTADSSGNYSFQVPIGWSGTITPSKAGYDFSPASMSYMDIQADQPEQNYSTSGVVITISGNAGVAGATLSYTDGTLKTVTADEAGLYSLDVSYNWSGSVTPSKTGYDFIPAARTYTNLTESQSSQDYTITTSRVWYVDKTNPACTDTGQVGSLAQPFCTISRGAYLAQPGQIVHVLHGTYAETVYPERSGTEGNPITYVADPGVTVTGRPETYTDPTHFTQYSAFALGSRNYIVIDGFTIDNTSYKGIYVDASHHVTIINNHVTRSGESSQGHPFEQGIYTRNTSYSTISNNITDHNTCIGIRVVGGDHNLISNNVSHSNFSTIVNGVVLESDAAGIELTGSSNNTVINNIVYSNEDSGINLYYWDGHGGAQYNLIVGNLVYENGDHGIDNYQSPNNTIIGNTVQGNGTVGINFEGNTAALGSFGGILINNIMSENGTTPPSGSWGGNLRFDANSVASSSTDYNLFYRTDATVQIIWNNLNYTSLAAFKAAVSGQEVHGLEGNPLFVDPVAAVRRQTGVLYRGLGIFGNYYTSAGSPAIDSANADAPNQPAFDIAGNSRIDDPATPNTGAGVRTYDDRGAYEYLPAGPSLPVVTTQAVSNIGLTTATGNGTIAATGLPNPTQHGCVWGLFANPTVLDNKTVNGEASEPGAFTCTITDLTPGTLYHVRAYATNDVGTVYGDDVTFTALLAPTVTTQAATNITSTTATGHGNITALGVPNPSQHGMVWNTTGAPTITDSQTSDGPVSAIGAFTSSLTGLTPGTTYYVRAYVQNDAAIGYGSEVTFTTQIAPTVTTQPVTNILTTTAVGNGNITALGIPNPTQHGVVWATTANPTTANNKTTDGPVSATGAFTSTITGLTPNTLYHVRAYATNAVSTVYGEDVTFTTLLAPTVTTQPVTDINTTTATCNGTVQVLGSSNPAEHGCVWSPSLNPTIADNKTTDGAVSAAGAFTSSITGLTPGTLYHVRAYATNDAGTAYGNDVTFTTWILPTVTTQTVTNITQTTAMGNGTIANLGVPNPTQYGFVWDINPNPTVALPTKTEKGSATVTGAFTSSITGLSLGQTYHIRAYATNAVGTAYGEDLVFTTLASSSSFTTPATNAGSGADVSGTGTGIWINPGNITAADNTYATVTLSGATSHYLQATNYGFAIPSNATINGIQVTIGRYESGLSSGNDVRDSVVRLLKSGTLDGSNKAATSIEWPTSLTAAAYGANNDLWGTTWTAADINAGNFGVALSVNSANNRIAYVDYIQIAVTYTVSVVSSTTSVNCGAGTPTVTYGSSVTCVATVTRGSGTFTPTGTVSWTTGGSGSFTPASSCTLSGTGSTATCSVTYTPSAVGTGSHLITASYAGDASFNPSSGSQTVTVNKKDASVTPDDKSKVVQLEPPYSDPPLTGTLTGFLPADGVTATYSRTPGETVGTYPITATLSPTNVLDNYNITNNPATFTIQPPPNTLTVDIVGEGNVTLSNPGPYNDGDQVTLTAVADPGWTFSSWEGCSGTGDTCTVTVHGATTVTATFVQVEYTLTITSAHAAVTKSPDQVTYHYGDEVTLTMGPVDPGWTFFNWSANVVNNKVTIQGNTTVTAMFTQDEYSLNIYTIGSGTVTKTPDKATYHYGDVVTLTPAPDPGWIFDHWSTNVVEGQVTIQGNTTVTGTFVAEEYTLTVETVGSGTVTRSPDQATYHYGDEVTLTANPEPGWSLGSWSSNVVDGKVTIHGNTTVTATFTQDEYTLTINTIGNGQVAKDPDKATYHYGDIVTLTATPDPGWSFGSWSENVVAGSITIQSNTTVTATFTQDEYTLTIDITGSGTVTKDPDQATYHYGDEVELTATPDLGWSFGSWSENVVDGSVTIQGNTTVTAAFTQDEYTLTINKIGSGSVTKDPDQVTYHYGAVVDLSATPDTGWSFGSWSENVVDGSVTIQGNTTVTATFTQDEYTLTINTIGIGQVTKDPDQVTYHYGDIVTLAAAPDPGWSFGSWSGNVFDARVEILGNTTVTATFTQDEYTLTIDITGNGQVAKDPDKATYHYGDIVTLTATPDPGWSFGSWSENVVAGSITIQSNTTVTATFTQDEYTLTIDITGSGTVTKDPDQATYHYGDVVTLSTTPEEGWGFVNWSENVVDNQITILSNTTVTATFKQFALPAVTTQAVTDITTTTATGNGNITDLGAPAVTQYGVVWDTAADPTIALSTKTEQGVPAGTGAFTSSITGLEPGTTYHIRAYATNTQGTVYGEDVTFITLQAPVVTTQAVTDIAATTATGNGSVDILGVPNPTQHGVVWSTSENPTTADSKTENGPVSASGAFASSITGLEPGTTYHVRAYATNAAGTVYGEDKTFTTHIAPEVATLDVTDITTSSATGHGEITRLGVPSPTQYGLVWDTAVNPTVALSTKTEQGVPSGTGPFTSNITGLTPGMLYYVRAYVTNAGGTYYGDNVTFTAYSTPVVTTQAVTNIGQITAIGNGNITSLGVPNPTQHGVVWATTANPTTANSKTEEGPVSATGPFASSITGLAPNTLYHVRAYVANDAGTVYGDDVTFTTAAATQVTFNTSGTWTAPAGVTSVTVEVWGGGGRGALVDSGFSEKAGGGGGGGAYAMSTITVTPGTNYAYTVGAGATTTAAGGDTYFINASTVMAKGGNSSSDESSTGASGGSAAASVGTIKYPGGNGANGSTGSNYGGGGGSSAGTGANGVNATNQNGATAPSGGGNGGNGRSSSSGSGSAGSTPGGGGGGAYRSSGSSLYGGGSGANGRIRITYVVAAVPTTTSVNCGAGTPSVTYGSSITCVATVTRTSGTANVTGTVSWTTSGAGSFTTSSCTLSGSGASATCSVTYTPSAVGTGSRLIRANYNGSASYLASSGSQTVTVNKAAASVTPNAASKTYGDADPTLSGTLTGFVAADNVTAAYSRTAGETVLGGPYAISATLSPSAVLANYDITYNTANFTINPKAASVTPDAASKTFGEADPVLSGTLEGFLPADNVTATYSRTPGETVEGSPYTISAVLSPEGVLSNYNITYNTASFTINPGLEYTLTINIVGNGSVTKTPDQSTYPNGTVVTLTPVAETGWEFSSWSENVVAGQVTISGDTTVTATFIEKVNQAPGFTSVAVTSVAEDVLYEYNITASDPNVGDSLVISAPTKPVWLNLVDNGDGTAVLSGTPTNSEVGDHSVVLQVSDGELTGEQAFTITVSNINDAPLFSSTPVTEANEDEQYLYNITASDPDTGAVLAISAPTLPGWLTLEDHGDGTAVLSGTPTNAEVGIHNVTLQVSDGELTGDQSFTIDVGNTNDGPVFTSEPVTAVDEDALYTYQITASDPDEGAVLVISAPTKPDWLSLVDNGDGTATLSGTPTNSEVGDHNVVLQVSDGVELASQTFTVTVANTNDAPVLVQPADQSSRQGDVVSLQISASDEDPGSVLSYAAEGLPEGLTIDAGSGLISGTVTAAPESYAVTVSVADGSGGTDSKTFTWQVRTVGYTLTVVIVGEGSVTKDPDKAEYGDGEEVSLSAMPAEGWVLSGWSENVVNGKVTIHEDTTVTVTFIRNVLGEGTHDDVDSRWSYSGWESMPAGDAYGGTLHYSTTVGSESQVSFTGKQIRFMYVAGPDTGTVEVYVDGNKVATLDQRNAYWDWQKSWTSDLLEAGEHVLRVVHASGGFTTIDALTVLGAPVIIGSGRYDDTEAAINYSGTAWFSLSGVSDPYGETLRYATTMGSESQVNFHGQQIQLTYLASPVSGQVEIYVDGVKIKTLDQHSAYWEWQKTWTSDLLEAGDHSLRVVQIGEGLASVDALTILDASSVLTSGVYDNRDAGVNYEGIWFNLDGVSGPNNGTLSYSTIVGNDAQVTFAGRQVKLTYLASPNSGMVDVYVDGNKVATIDQHSPNWDWQKTWTSDLLEAGEHSLRIVHVSGELTSVDGVEVVGSPVILGSGEYDDFNPAINYEGRWLTMESVSGPYDGTLHYTYGLGEAAQVNFHGRQIELTYLAAPTAGRMEIYLDGEKVATLDQYNVGWVWQQSWTSEVLADGDHSLRIVHITEGSDSLGSIDAITVIP